MWLNMYKGDEIIGQVREGERADFPDMVVCPAIVGWAMDDYRLEEADPEPLPSATERLQAKRETMVISRFQLRGALVSNGQMAEAETVIASSEDPMVQVAWQDASEFKRNGKTVISLIEGLELTDEEMDSLFEFAKTLEA